MEEDKIIIDLPEIGFYKEYTLEDVYKVPQHFDEVTREHEPDKYLYIIGDMKYGWLDTYYIKHVMEDEQIEVYDTRVKVIEIPVDEKDFDEDGNIVEGTESQVEIRYENEGSIMIDPNPPSIIASDDEELNIEDDNEINNNESEDEE